MAPEVKILVKQEFLNTAIAFGHSGVALKGRSTLELVELGIIARSSGNPMLLNFFEALPEMDELKLFKIRLLEDRIKLKMHAGKKNIEGS